MSPASPSGARLREHLLDVLEPVVAATGYDLEDVKVSSAGRRSVVRVIVDSDSGVDLDAVADVSRAVSAALDDDTPGGAAFAGPYVLEVSSPGVDRPLTEPRHWRRARGRLVAVTHGDRQLTGRVVAADDTTVTLDVAGSAERIPLAELGPGRVQVEFGRPSESEPEGIPEDELDDDEMGDDELDEDGGDTDDTHVINDAEE
jgi:ribosome maturation factor RimP